MMTKEEISNAIDKGLSDCVIMSFSKMVSYQLRRGKNFDTIIGSWLFELAKELCRNEEEAMRSIFYLGVDEKNRVEIACKIPLFEKLKTHPLFIMKAEDLRRLRSGPVRNVIHSLAFPIGVFDNDLDNQ